MGHSTKYEARRRQPRRAQSRVRFAAARIDGITTMAEVDQDTGEAMRIERGDGIVRVQLGRIEGGRIVVRTEHTVDTLCAVEAVADCELIASVAPRGLRSVRPAAVIESVEPLRLAEVA